MFDAIKTLAELVKKVSDAELKAAMLQLVTDARQETFDVQEKNLALQSENRSLRDDLDRAKNKDAMRETLTFRDNAYWKKTKDGELPHCLACFDSAGNLSVLSRVGDGPSARCFVCKAQFASVFPGSESDWGTCRLERG